MGNLLMDQIPILGEAAIFLAKIHDELEGGNIDSEALKEEIEDLVNRIGQAQTQEPRIFMTTTNWRGAMHVCNLRFSTDETIARQKASYLTGGDRKIYELFENAEPKNIKV